MELTMSILVMLGGVAVFMFGMKQMSQSLGQGAGGSVSKLFNKISKNRVVDYGIGIGATALVQSSSATSIMTVGLANAGIIEVKNGSGIILGAKVGTTLTAFMFALSGVNKGSFSMSAIFAAIAFVGVLILFMSDNEKVTKIAQFLAGFGLLFAGLELMENAIGGSDSVLSVELQKVFQFEIMYNPICLVILGVVFTGIIQSSTAATGLFLIFLMTGVIDTIDQSFFLIMGANIGTCTDGLMASIGTNSNGKRIAIFHLLSSVIGAIMFTIVLIIFRAPIVNAFEGLFPGEPQWSLATFNLLYNVIYTLILLVFLTPLVNLVKRLVGTEQAGAIRVKYIDDLLLATPTLAIENSIKEVYDMAVLARKNVERAFEGLINEVTTESKEIATTEDEIDEMTSALASYFIKISSVTQTREQGQTVGRLHHVITDLERIGDYAVLLDKETASMKHWDAHFMDQTKGELLQIYSKLTEMFYLTLDAFKTRDTENLPKIAEIQSYIKELLTTTRDEHITRLSSNMYSVEVSKSLYSVLFSLERITDHLVNVAFSIKSDTGSKADVLESITRDDFE